MNRGFFFLGRIRGNTTIDPGGWEVKSRGIKGKMEVLIVGLGNPIAGDDGVGYHIVKYLKTEPLPYGVQAVEGGTDPFGLLDYLKNTRHVILLDAIQTGGIPGTIYQIPLEGLPAQRRGFSQHQFSLLHVYQSREFRRRLNLPQGVLLAVEVGEYEIFSENLSPTLLSRMPAIVEKILKQAKKMLGVELYSIENKEQRKDEKDERVSFFPTKK